MTWTKEMGWGERDGIDVDKWDRETWNNRTRVENPSSEWTTDVPGWESVPSLENFISSELTFSSKGQSNYLGQTPVALWHTQKSSEEVSERSGGAVVKNQAESQFLGRSQWPLYVDCSVELQLNRPLLFPLLCVSEACEELLWFCHRFILKAVFIS